MLEGGGSKFYPILACSLQLRRVPVYPPAQVCTGVLSTCVCTCVDGEEGERGVKCDEIEEEGEKWLLATSPIFYPFCFFICEYCV